jgi:hypothetical protein
MGLEDLGMPGVRAGAARFRPLFFGCRIQNMNADPLCKCGHPFSVHNRDIHDDGRTMKADPALLPPKQYDITTDRPAGESGCDECACRQMGRGVSKEE